jgi:hypothetical protein
MSLKGNLSINPQAKHLGETNFDNFFHFQKPSSPMERNQL